MPKISILDIISKSADIQAARISTVSCGLSVFIRDVLADIFLRALYFKSLFFSNFEFISTWENIFCYKNIKRRLNMKDCNRLHAHQDILISKKQLQDLMKAYLKLITILLRQSCIRLSTPIVIMNAQLLVYFLL